MTNNTPDYENNLFFDAQNTKNEQQKDLYIKVEKQVWESTLKASMDRAGRIEILEQQLAIAVESLKWYDGLEKMLIGWEIATGQERGTAEKALQQIKELEK